MKNFKALRPKTPVDGRARERTDFESSRGYHLIFMLKPPKSREDIAKEKGFPQCENCGNYYDNLEFPACPKCGHKPPPSTLKILLDKIFFWIRIFKSK